MTTLDIAKAVTGLLKKHDHAGATAYLADDAVSIEAMDGPMARIQGIEAIKQKQAWWQGAHEVHGGEVHGPYVNGDIFLLRFTYDVTEKATGKRMQLDEIATYTVKGDKIVEERFAYYMG